MMELVDNKIDNDDYDYSYADMDSLVDVHC